MKTGDTKKPAETPDAGFRPAPDDPDFARQTALAEEIMYDDRKVLKELAK